MDILNCLISGGDDCQWVWYIISGIGITLKYSIIPVFFGLIIGVLLSLMNLSNNIILKIIAKSYISIIRGTPLLVQLFLVYYAIPGELGVDISISTAGILAFSLNSGAYVAEIIRSGIQSVDKGQLDASKALSLSYYSTMKDIVIPQAVRNILPALMNEVVSMVKESALISVIGEADLMRRAQTVVAETYEYLPAFLTATACYYILISILTYFARLLEKKLYAKY